MPKDEFDFDDPMELNGVGLVCEEDTTEAMTECFVEEFMRLGHNAKQILAMFSNPHYIGMNLALEKRGEQFVRDMISEVFARWGMTGVAPVSNFSDPIPIDGDRRDACPTLTDPMGVPIPKLNQ